MFIDVASVVFRFWISFFLKLSETMTSTLVPRSSTTTTPARQRHSTSNALALTTSSSSLLNASRSSLRSVTPSNCQALVTEAMNNRRGGVSVKLSSPIDATLQSQRIGTSKSLSWKLTVGATRYRSIILTSPPDNIISDLIDACGREFHVERLYRLFTDVADFCRSIPQIPSTFGEATNIPEVTFDTIPYDDDDTETIRRHVDKINMRYVGYYHDHEQYNINNASVAMKLHDVHLTEEYRKYLSYINKVSNMLDWIVKLDMEIEQLKMAKVRCEREGWSLEDDDDADDDNPQVRLLSTADDVKRMIESGGEITMYALNLMKPLIEPLSHVRKHCSKCDAKMKLYLHELNQLNMERDAERQRRQARTPANDPAAFSERVMVPKGPAANGPAAVTNLVDLLEMHVPIGDKMPLSDLVKVYHDNFGVKMTQADLTREITATGQFKVVNSRNKRYVRRV